jgi:hypothetical protein
LGGLALFNLQARIVIGGLRYRRPGEYRKPLVSARISMANFNGSGIHETALCDAASPVKFDF